MTEDVNRWNCCTRMFIGAALPLLLLLASTGPATAQIISGTISGTVVDATDAAVVGASVTLINKGTQAIRETKADQAGLFGFASVQPGMYTLRISAAGFTTLNSTDNVLRANSLLDLGRIALAVGQTTDSVTITSRGDLVQTGSSENAALLSSRQIDNLSVRGRDVTSLLQLLPGVSVGAVNEVPNGPGYGNALPNIMGHPTSWDCGDGRWAANQRYRCSPVF
ncbi:MAG TPA: carboxypeptidase-like regulatory domain-containing protein [Bryobacteraceae bacterium]|nr:carboxypeptidase-like regulatory domain-containing protein [Bryobacteraceae bacterium]